MFPETPIKVAPSILSADFARLGAQVVEAVEAGANQIHIDVMDGHFVPAITFGPLVVEAVRSVTSVPLDIHLMMEEPERLIPTFAQAGGTILTVHVEACVHLHRVVHLIKETGARAGVALNPATPVTAIEDVLPDLDVVLAMTVNPGLPGQPFLSSVVPKIALLRQMLNQQGLLAELEVDGGIGPATAGTVVQAGARVLVAGSAVFSSPAGIAQAIARIREGARASHPG